MTAGPLVSVIIPTYRRPALLVEALASVKAQTYGNLEALVVNDAPEDAATVHEIVEALGDARFSALQQPRQAGGASARNAGIARARGDIVAFLDDDDLYLPEKLERHVLAHWSDEPHVGVVYSGVVRRWLEVRRPDVACPEGEAPRDVTRSMLQGRFCPTTTSCVSVLSGALRQVGTFDGELGSFDDWDLWLRLSRSERFRSLPEPLVVFRQHASPRLSQGYAERLQHLQRAAAKWRGVMDETAFVGAYAFSAAYDEASARLEKGRDAIEFLATLKRLFSHVHRPRQWLAIARFMAKYVLGPTRSRAMLKARSGSGP